MSKIMSVENLIYQQELLASTPELKALYNKTIKNVLTKIDDLFVNGNADRKYAFSANVLSDLTKQLKLRNENSRYRLFKHINSEILSPQIVFNFK